MKPILLAKRSISEALANEPSDTGEHGAAASPIAFPRVEASPYAINPMCAAEQTS